MSETKQNSNNESSSTTPLISKNNSFIVSPQQQMNIDIKPTNNTINNPNNNNETNNTNSNTNTQPPQNNPLNMLFQNLFQKAILLKAKYDKNKNNLKNKDQHDNCDHDHAHDHHDYIQPNMKSNIMQMPHLHDAGQLLGAGGPFIPNNINNTSIIPEMQTQQQPNSQPWSETHHNKFYEGENKDLRIDSAGLNNMAEIKDESFTQNNQSIKAEDQIFVFSDKENNVVEYLATLEGIGLAETSTTKPDGKEGKDYIQIEFCPYLTRPADKDSDGAKKIFEKLGLKNVEQKREQLVNEKQTNLMKSEKDKNTKSIFVKINTDFKGLAVNCGDLVASRTNFFEDPKFGNNDLDTSINCKAMFKINDFFADKCKEHYVSVMGNHEVMSQYTSAEDEKILKKRLEKDENRKMSYMIKNDKGQVITFSHTGKIDTQRIEDFRKSGQKDKTEIITRQEADNVFKGKRDNNFHRLFDRPEDGALDNKVENGIIFHGHNMIIDLYKGNKQQYWNWLTHKGYFDVNRNDNQYYMIDKNNLSTVYGCDNGKIRNIHHTGMGFEEQNKVCQDKIKNINKEEIKNEVNLHLQSMVKIHKENMNNLENAIGESKKHSFVINTPQLINESIHKLKVFNAKVEEEKMLEDIANSDDYLERIYQIQNEYKKDVHEIQQYNKIVQNILAYNKKCMDVLDSAKKKVEEMEEDGNSIPDNHPNKEQINNEIEGAKKKLLDFQKTVEKSKQQSDAYVLLEKMKYAYSFCQALPLMMEGFNKTIKKLTLQNGNINMPENNTNNINAQNNEQQTNNNTQNPESQEELLKQMRMKLRKEIYNLAQNDVGFLRIQGFKCFDNDKRYKYLLSLLDQDLNQEQIKHANDLLASLTDKANDALYLLQKMETLNQKFSSFIENKEYKEIIDKNPQSIKSMYRYFNNAKKIFHDLKEMTNLDSFEQMYTQIEQECANHCKLGNLLTDKYYFMNKCNASEIEFKDYINNIKTKDENCYFKNQSKIQSINQCLINIETMLEEEITDPDLCEEQIKKIEEEYNKYENKIDLLTRQIQTLYFVNSHNERYNILLEQLGKEQYKNLFSSNSNNINVMRQHLINAHKMANEAEEITDLDSFKKMQDKINKEIQQVREIGELIEKKMSAIDELEQMSLLEKQKNAQSNQQQTNNNTQNPESQEELLKQRRMELRADIDNLVKNHVCWLRDRGFKCFDNDKDYQSLLSLLDQDQDLNQEQIKHADELFFTLLKQALEIRSAISECAAFEQSLNNFLQTAQIQQSKYPKLKDFYSMNNSKIEEMRKYLHNTKMILDHAKEIEDLNWCYGQACEICSDLQHYNDIGSSLTKQANNILEQIKTQNNITNNDETEDTTEEINTDIDNNVIKESSQDNQTNNNNTNNEEEGQKNIDNEEENKTTDINNNSQNNNSRQRSNIIKRENNIRKFNNKPNNRVNKKTNENESSSNINKSDSSAAPTSNEDNKTPGQDNDKDKGKWSTQKIIACVVVSVIFPIVGTIVFFIIDILFFNDKKEPVKTPEKPNQGPAPTPNDPNKNQSNDNIRTADIQKKPKIMPSIQTQNNNQNNIQNTSAITQNLSKPNLLSLTQSRQGRNSQESNFGF